MPDVISRLEHDASQTGYMHGRSGFPRRLPYRRRVGWPVHLNDIYGRAYDRGNAERGQEADTDD